MTMPHLGGYYEWPDDDHYLACEQHQAEGGACICEDIERDAYEDAMERKYDERREAQ